jgi:Uncharacterized protein conserved in bacteria
MPNVPTFEEAGVAGMNSSTQWGVYGPKGLSADIVVKLNSAFNEALKDPKVQERAASLGYVTAGGSPEDFVKLTRSEIEKWADVIKSANIKISN